MNQPPLTVACTNGKWYFRYASGSRWTKLERIKEGEGLDGRSFEEVRAQLALEGITAKLYEA